MPVEGWRWGVCLLRLRHGMALGAGSCKQRQHRAGTAVPGPLGVLRDGGAALSFRALGHASIEGRLV